MKNHLQKADANEKGVFIKNLMKNRPSVIKPISLICHRFSNKTSVIQSHQPKKILKL